MSLAHHYGRAKQGLMGISPKAATEHAERLLIAGGTGAALGLLSAGLGGLDKTLFGMRVPLDGLASFGLSAAGLAMDSPELLTASIAAAGSASTRSFEAIFKKGFGAHGEFDSIGDNFQYGAEPLLEGHGHQPAYGGQFSAYGFGGENAGNDRILAAAAAANF